MVFLNRSSDVKNARRMKILFVVDWDFQFAESLTGVLRVFTEELCPRAQQACAPSHKNAASFSKD